MADNVIANPGAGGATLATDEIVGVHFPRLKLTLGADGVNDGDVSAGNPLPISATSLPLPTGAATQATLAARFAAVTPKSVDVSASGNHLIHTPAAGQRIRLVWVYAQATAALGDGVVEVAFRFGAAGPLFYKHELTGSQPFAHGAVVEGGVDEPLFLNTSSAARVLGNVDLREFT